MFHTDASLTKAALCLLVASSCWQLLLPCLQLLAHLPMWKELLEQWEQLTSCHQNQMLQNQMPNWLHHLLLL